jgi:hypothetical protein
VRREDVVPIVSPIDDVIESTRKLHPKLPCHASYQRESLARSSSDITNSGAALSRGSPGSLTSETCNASTPSVRDPFGSRPLRFACSPLLARKSPLSMSSNRNTAGCGRPG